MSDRRKPAEGPAPRFGLDRREWTAVVGAGLLHTAAARVLFGPGVAAAEMPPSTRLPLGEDGSNIVLTGQVEVGQGWRTEVL